MPTLFERIIAREIPAHIVHEDDHTLAFLDIGPVARGHTLLIPKEPAATLDALPDDAAAAVGRVLPRLCRAVRDAVGAPALNVLQNNGAAAGQAVNHVHFHLIPRFGDDAFRFAWPAGELTDPDTLRDAITAGLQPD